MPEPARTLRDAFNAVDPALPLPPDDPRYVDCTDVRGDENAILHLYHAITWANRHTHQLFTGHRGCGKSTELLRLEARLEQAGFAVLYFAADVDLDAQDLRYSDLLLAIARRVESEMRERDMPLDADLLKNIERWFAESLYTEDEWRNVQRELGTQVSLGVPAILSPFAQLAAYLTGQIRTGREIKNSIRQKLDPRIAQLIDNVNLLLADAALKVRRRGQTDLVLLIDNLDRIALTDLGGGRTSHDSLYIEHGEQLTALDCHIVYTVPISMFYGPKATILRSIFPENHVLPMIKTHEPRARGGNDSAAGLARLRQILAGRLDLDRLFEPDAVEPLCRACGGHPRDLMVLAHHAIEYATERPDQPITLEAVRRAEGRLVAAYSRTVLDAHFPKLARVHLTNQIVNDPDHQQMLYNLSVLEYANGLEPWHDAHPAVQLLARFKQALADERPKLLNAD
ncbi:MAG TPA: hypothetical protein VIK33_03875 [Anaerolineae bacterium]